jgi:hypothetical protein
MVNQDMTPARLWQRFLRQMTNDCQNPEVKSLLANAQSTDPLDPFTLTDIFDAIDQRHQYVVFLLDEFENVTENQSFGPDFFYGLRSLATHHNLSLITSSRRELIDLCHSEAVRASPFFNIFANINVRLFTKTETSSFISDTLDDSTISFAAAEIEFLFRLAGYHPYFLQVACYFLFEAYSQNIPTEERLPFLNKLFREEAHPHFDDYWRCSNNMEKIVLTTLALLKQQGKAGEHAFSLKQLQTIYTRSTQILSNLEKRGFVVAETNSYSLFNTSFGEWICNEITDTMNDHQSYEEWLQSNKALTERLSRGVKNELGVILPRINAQYRELIIHWASDPKNWLVVIQLLKMAVGIG